MNRRGNKKKSVLMVASFGGHWVQLRRLEPAFSDYKLIYVTTEKSCQSQLDNCGFYVVTDAALDSKLKMIRMALEVFFVVLKNRPTVVVSTGAAPGFFSLVFGRMLGARTIWVDSIANVQHMSVSGLKVRPFADLWLTQWEHLAKKNGPYYRGKVL
jgi:UDP-N-acetylglucosamine:LPS N-acetylglucosamine transferase